MRNQLHMEMYKNEQFVDNERMENFWNHGDSSGEVKNLNGAHFIRTAGGCSLIEGVECEEVWQWMEAS